jgi:hypothetical protein
MNKVANKYQLNEIVSISVLKKKFKQYLIDAGREGFKSSVFPKYLVISLVLVLEEILSDCLEYVKKHEINGLYVLNSQNLLMVLNTNNKYDFVLKYLKKYNSTIKYQDSVLFNYRKVVDNLEFKYGDKLQIDSEARNFVSYILLSLQYELIKLSLTMVVFSKRKTLSADSLLCSISYLFEEMYSKIKLKLDSMVTIKAEEEDTEDAEDVEEGEEDVEKGEEDVEKGEEDVEKGEEDVEKEEEEEDDVEKEEGEDGVKEDDSLVEDLEVENKKEIQLKSKSKSKDKVKVVQIDEFEEDLEEKPENKKVKSGRQSIKK